MADTKISALPAGTTIAGTEPFPGVQSGVTVQLTAVQIKTFTSSSPTLVTPVIGVATGTSLALGGATIGTDALAVTGTVATSGSIVSGNIVRALNFQNASGGKFFWINRTEISAPADSSILFNDTAGTHSAILSFPGLTATPVLQLGAADAAAPVAQILQVQSVVAGTSNTAGTNFTIGGSKGTGTGIGGSLIFQTAPAGSTGTAQNALTTALTLDSTGLATFASNLTTAGSYLFTGNGGWSSIGNGGVALRNAAASNSVNFAVAGNNVLQLGAFDNASPSTQQFQVQSVAGGTSNTAGADWSFFGSKGTGTGAGGSLKFFTSPAGSTGSAQNAGVLALTIDSNGDFTAKAGAQWLWGGNARMVSPASGNFQFNTAGVGTGFGLLQLGGSTSSFPAIKRNGSGIQIKVADDSGLADLSAQTITAGASLVATTNVTAGNALIATSSTYPGGVGNAFLTSPTTSSIRVNNNAGINSFDITAGAANLATFNGGITTGSSIISGDNILAANTSALGSVSRGFIKFPADGQFSFNNNAATSAFTVIVGANNLASFNGPINTLTTVVASLPAAGTAGRRAFVTDALTPAFGAAVVGGGAVKVPVYDTGSAWVVG